MTCENVASRFLLLHNQLLAHTQRDIACYMLRRSSIIITEQHLKHLYNEYNSNRPTQLSLGVSTLCPFAPADSLQTPSGAATCSSLNLVMNCIWCFCISNLSCWVRSLVDTVTVPTLVTQKLHSLKTDDGGRPHKIMQYGIQ